MSIAKVVFGGNTLVDLTKDTITESDLAKGVTAHNKVGDIITGSNTFDADTSDGTANASELLDGEIAYVNGERIVGKMPNNGSQIIEISTLSEEPNIYFGSHDGSGKAKIANAEKSKIVPENIRKGVIVLGVEGEMTGSEDIKVQSKTVVPSKNQQTILPDAEYNYLSQIIVEGIPYKETPNASGGITVTIG